LAKELGGVLFSLSLADRASSSDRSCFRFLIDLGRDRNAPRLVEDFVFLGFVGELGSLDLESLGKSLVVRDLSEIVAKVLPLNGDGGA